MIGSAPSRLKTTPSLPQTCRAIPMFRLTTGQSSSDCSSSRLRHLKSAIIRLSLPPTFRSNWFPSPHTNSQPPHPYILSESTYSWSKKLSSDAWEVAPLVHEFRKYCKRAAATSHPDALRTLRENVCTWNVPAYNLCYGKLTDISALGTPPTS